MSNLKKFQSLGPEIKEEEITYSKKDKLGEGSYGVVYKGTCRGFPVAIKIPKLPKGQTEFSDEQLQAFREEIKVMSKLYNPRIALFMGAFVSPKSIKIVSELLDGDFERVLLNKRKDMTLMQRAIYLRQAAEGMAWLHGAGVVHCDYKPSNLLWDQKTKSVKVCDFGLSMLVKHGEILQNEEAKGTPLYIAPEVVLEEGSSSARDVYSYGIGIYCFVTRKEPFSHHNNLQQFLRAITRDVNPERPVLPTKETSCPTSLRELAEQCWHSDYTKRPNFQDILKAFDKDIIVDCATFDDEGRAFWKKHFYSKEGLQTEVKWKHFIEPFAETYFKNAKDEKSVEHKCLKAILSPNEKTVTLETFGKILGFLGPLKKKNWVQKLAMTLAQEYFWGATSGSVAQKNLCTHKDGAFLVRFSSKGSNFTLSFVGGNKIWHTRIIHPYGSNKFALDGAPNKVYKSLAALIDATKESGTISDICPGNPFKNLFEDTNESGGYATLQYDDSSEELDI